MATEESRRSTDRSSPRERRLRLPEHLPVVEEVIPQAVQAAPQQWRRIGEEKSERLDCEPAQFSEVTSGSGEPFSVAPHMAHYDACGALVCRSP